jgi:hypothetical protein
LPANYITANSAHNNFFLVKEINTGQIVKKFNTKELKQARDLTNKLNRGCGFNGTTPKFFIS